MAVFAAAIALGSMAVGVGPVAAKTAALQGNLHCTPGGSTTISPGILLTANLLPNGKDKKIKYVTSGAGACTGTATAGGPSPTSFTTASKSKGLSRLLVQPASACSNVPRFSKTSVTFPTGAKMKVNLASDLVNYAYNTTTHVSTPFPACGGDSSVATAFAIAHATDRIETRSHGTSTGKAYSGKLVTSISRTTETLIAELADANDPSGVGITVLHGDPTISTFQIG
jgi:hypothetical protein